MLVLNFLWRIRLDVTCLSQRGWSRCFICMCSVCVQSCTFSLYVSSIRENRWCYVLCSLDRCFIISFITSLIWMLISPLKIMEYLQRHYNLFIMISSWTTTSSWIMCTPIPCTLILTHSPSPTRLCLNIHIKQEIK